MVARPRVAPRTMMNRNDSRITSLLAAAVLSGCAGADSTAPLAALAPLPPPPTTGTLQISIVTTGVDLDNDGFVLGVDSDFPRGVPANGTLSLTMEPGVHTLGLSGIALNCD